MLSAAGWILLGAVIRGYSGFGSAAISVAGLSMLFPPIQVIPIILMLEIVAGIHMLPRTWRYIDWRQLRWILFGAIIATPIGLELLTRIPADAMRIAIYTIILMMGVMIGVGLRIPHGEHASTITSAGMACGFMNGAAGVGGLPLVVFFLSKDEKTVTLRATLTAFFIGMDLYTCGIASAHGLIGSELLTWVLVLMIPLIIGTAIGNRKFYNSRPGSFQRFALALLILVSSGGLIHSLTLGS